MKIHYFRHIVFCFMLCAGTIFQLAGQNSVKDTITIEEVVVTGTPVRINRNNIPMAVSVLHQSQIAESDESALLPMLSGRVPGLFVTERGGHRLWCCYRGCRANHHPGNRRQSYNRCIDADRRSSAVHGYFWAPIT